MVDESVYFVVNPNSKGGQTGKKWDDNYQKIKQYLDCEVEYGMADGIGEGNKMTERGIERGFDIIVAVGGEGTINEVVNAVYYNNQNDTKVGFIRGGTSNDYLNQMGWPFDLYAQLDIIKQGRVERRPLLKVKGDTERVGLNIANSGIAAKVAYMASVERKLAWIKSSVRYTILALRAILSWKNIPVTITTDKNEFSGDLTLLMSGFSQEIGNYKTIPHAELTGDKMAYTIAIDFSKWKMLKLLRTLKKGTHSEDIDGVYMRYSNSIQIEAEKPLLFELDGEPFSYESSSISIDAIHDAIPIICK